MDTKETITDTNEINIRDTVNVVSNDSDHAKVFKAVLFKTERLVSAVHLVTSLMDTEDQLRWQLRTACVDSLKDFYNIGQWQVNDSRSFVSDEIFKKISFIISLLDVGHAGGMISTMNYKILREEYLKLRGTLETLKVTTGSNSFSLPEDFFGADLKSLNLATSQVINPTPRSLSTTTQQEVISDFLKDNSAVSFRKSNMTDKTLAKKNLAKDVAKSNLKRTPRTSDKSSRQETIISILKGGGIFTIKDIISKILSISPGVDCSEKTIQRDLTFLVSKGTLLKQGDRRWSRYSLSVESRPDSAELV